MADTTNEDVLAAARVLAARIGIDPFVFEPPGRDATPASGLWQAEADRCAHTIRALAANDPETIRAAYKSLGNTDRLPPDWLDVTAAQILLAAEQDARRELAMPSDLVDSAQRKRCSPPLP